MLNFNIETEPTAGPKPVIPAYRCIAPAKREIKSARTVLIKAMISSFYQYHSGCVFYCSRIARKAEAGRGGILRSINISATCPAMWRLTFSGGGQLVRLSANGCQPHRPNTALIFCAAGYHPGLLRTFHEYSLNFYTVHLYTLWYSTRFISSNVSCVIALPYVIIRSGTGDFPLEMGGWI